MTSKGLSLRDNRILALATKGATAEEIGNELGIPAVRVVSELDRLTKSMDWLSTMQESALVMRALKSLIGSLQERAESGQDDKQTRNYLDALRLNLERLDRLEDKAGADIERVESAHARVFVEIVEKSFYHALGALTERFKDLPTEAIEEQFKESISIVAHEYDSENS